MRDWAAQSIQGRIRSPKPTLLSSLQAKTCLPSTLPAQTYQSGAGGSQWRSGGLQGRLASASPTEVALQRRRRWLGSVEPASGSAAGPGQPRIRARGQTARGLPVPVAVDGGGRAVLRAGHRLLARGAGARWAAWESQGRCTCGGRYGAGQDLRQSPSVLIQADGAEVTSGEGADPGPLGA